MNSVLVGAADNGGGSACEGTRGIWDISAPSAQFWCEPKTALKIKSEKNYTPKSGVKCNVKAGSLININVVDKDMFQKKQFYC